MLEEKSEIVILIIGATILMLILFSFIITILFMYQKKQIAFQNNIELMKFEHDKNIMQAKLEIQEHTLDIVSREIHDNIGLSLTLAKLNLNTLQQNNNDYEKINSSIELIGEAIKDLSDISKSLNPEIININGLLRVLEMEVSRINKTGIYKILMEITGEPRFLCSSKELIIYRIVQEALQNSIKHSKAKNVQISLNYKINELELTLCDDGIGFTENEFTSNHKQTRAGLNNIRYRAKVLEGKCQIQSVKNKGTVIFLSVPVKNELCLKQ